ncbi:uncharacterized protein EI97DRAFT_8595 [Westerdykella ornata]|uniref:Uncharacterized protein n=1 Tax=Westerdykella ornata TaxID=318751 RepID=A0A6A6JW25_WESOR|nr:uncharacterized protein EI97DRAFT_8595 [Westerdykella ornata]KAF2280802.1 hypothetical protein EI97DRAFT_8595 [Westerdykella ornata]
MSLVLDSGQATAWAVSVWRTVALVRCPPVSGQANSWADIRRQEDEPKLTFLLVSGQTGSGELAGLDTVRSKTAKSWSGSPLGQWTMGGRCYASAIGLAIGGRGAGPPWALLTLDRGTSGKNMVSALSLPRWAAWHVNRSVVCGN